MTYSPLLHDIFGAFLDLPNTFVREGHKGLLYKITCNGINGPVHSLLEFFLPDRQQRVALNKQ